MKHIKHVIDVVDISKTGLTQDQIKKLMANINKVFIATADTAEAATAEANAYYDANPGVDYRG